MYCNVFIRYVARGPKCHRVEAFVKVFWEHIMVCGLLLLAMNFCLV